MAKNSSSCWHVLNTFKFISLRTFAYTGKRMILFCRYCSTEAWGSRVHGRVLGCWLPCSHHLKCCCWGSWVMGAQCLSLTSRRHRNHLCVEDLDRLTVTFLKLLFVYFWLCGVFVAAFGLSPVSALGCHSLVVVCRLLIVVASLIEDHGL